MKVLLSGDGDPGQAFEFKGTGFGAVTGILAGAATAFYAFLGFEDSVNMAEEIRDPIRTFPPALITGIVAAGIIYLLVGFTAAMVVPLDVLTESSGPLLEVVHIGLPDYDAGTLFSVIAMIAVSNTMLINMLMASRLLYGMANRGVLPAPFAWVSPRRTPWVAIAFTTALSILLLLTVDDLCGPVRHHRAPADLGVPAGQHLRAGAAARPGRSQPLRGAHDHAVHRGGWSPWCSCCPSTAPGRSTAPPSTCWSAASSCGGSTSW